MKDGAAHWPTPGKRLVECQGVSRDLGTEALKTRILFDVDLTIHEGEFVSLTGFSGSGKSTLLYLIGALDRPDTGRITLDGVDIGTLGDNERARLRSEKLGFVFQFHFLLPEFTVLENVLLPMLRRGERSRASAERHATRVLDMMGLSDLLGRRPAQLSGGQQQRVSIARAVANDPRLILADEPTGNLDSHNGALVMSLFEHLVRQEGRTVVMVTHERSFAQRCSRQIVMKDGRIVEDIDQRAWAGEREPNAPEQG